MVERTACLRESGLGRAERFELEVRLIISGGNAAFNVGQLPGEVARQPKTLNAASV
jgi:hypothetical protein